jgi:hypothetical protein
MTPPLTGLLSPFTALSSVDLPEPRQTHQHADLALADIEARSGHPEHRAGLVENGAAGFAAVRAARAPSASAVPKMMSTSRRIRPCVICFSLGRVSTTAHPVENDGEHHDGEARLDSHGMFTVLSALTTGLPSPLAPDQRRDHHHRQRQHDACVRPAMIEGERGGSSTFHNSWRLVAPNASPASISCFGTVVIPRWVRRIGAATAKITVVMSPGASPSPNSMSAGMR